HPLRQALAAVEAAAGEPLADARHLEQVEVEDRLRPGAEVVEVVAAEEYRDVVRLEDRLRGIAREADRVEQHADGLVLRPRGAPVDRDVLVRQPGDEAAEVRESPGDGDAEPGGALLVAAVDLREDVFERALGVAELPPPLGDLDARGDELVVERRDDDLD